MSGTGGEEASLFAMDIFKMWVTALLLVFKGPFLLSFMIPSLHKMHQV